MQNVDNLLRKYVVIRMIFGGCYLNLNHLQEHSKYLHESLYQHFVLITSAFYAHFYHFNSPKRQIFIFYINSIQIFKAENTVKAAGLLRIIINHLQEIRNKLQHI